jgi:hypothetical protein
MRASTRTARRAVFGVVAVPVALLVLAQLLLPGFAAQQMRDELGRYGKVRSASISAFPAIELLWGHAESAAARAGTLTMSTTQAGALLWKARNVQRIDLSADVLHLGPFAMHAATLQKRGARLYASGNVTEADMRAPLPSSTGVRVLGSTPEGIALRVSGSAFGPTPSIEVLLTAREGKMVAQPKGVPFAGVLDVTLLSDPHLYVQSLSLATPASAGSRADPTYRLGLTAELR